MVTVCWAAKGGSGTTVVAATLTLNASVPTLLVDLDGELPTVLGLAEPDRPGVGDWLRSDAPASHLDDLLIRVGDQASLLPWRPGGVVTGDARALQAGADADRRRQLVDWLVGWGATPLATLGTSEPTQLIGRRTSRRTRRRHRWGWTRRRPVGGESTSPEPRAVQVIVDAGTGEPWPELVAAADRSLLVTRRCYLALRRAGRMATRPSGVVVVDEPGRALSERDIEAALGAPIVASVSLDPAIARAVDSGLLSARLPSVMGRELTDVAA